MEDEKSTGKSSPGNCFVQYHQQTQNGNQKRRTRDEKDVEVKIQTDCAAESIVDDNFRDNENGRVARGDGSMELTFNKTSFPVDKMEGTIGKKVMKKVRFSEDIVNIENFVDNEDSSKELVREFDENTSPLVFKVASKAPKSPGKALKFKKFENADELVGIARKMFIDCANDCALTSLTEDK